MNIILQSLSAAFAAQAQLVRNLDPMLGVELMPEGELRAVLVVVEEMRGHIAVIEAAIERALDGGRLQ